MDDTGGSSEGSRLSDSDTILRGAAFSAFGRIVATVVRFGTSVLITRTLGAESYGLFAVANRFAGAGSTTARAGQHDAIMHFLPKYRAARDLAGARGAFFTSLSLAFGTSLVMAVGLYAASELVAERLLDNSALAPVMRVLAFGIPFAVLGAVLTAALRGLKNVRALEWVRSFTMPVGRLVFCAAFFTLGYGILGLAWAINGSLVIAFVAALYFLRKSSPLLSGDGGVRLELGKVLAFSMPVLVLGLVTFVYSNADVFFLVRYDSAANVGIYALGIRILSIVQIPITVFQSMFVPLASELYGSRNIERLDQVFKSTTRWVVTGTLPIYILVVIEAEPLLAIFGEEFVAGAAVLSVLGSIAMTNLFAVLAGYIVYMSGRSGIVLMNAVMLMLGSTALYWFLVPEHGLMGAAFGRALAFAGFALLTLVETYFMIGIHPFHAALLKPMVSGVLSFGLCKAIALGLPAGSLTTLGLGAVFCVAYVGILIGLGLTEEDRALVGRMMSRVGLGSRNNRIDGGR